MDFGFTHVTLAACEVDVTRQVVHIGDREVGLTAKETELFAYLVERAGQVVEHNELLSEVWGYAPDTATKTVYTTAYHLRKKIEVDPKNPAHLETVRGGGYRLTVDDDAIRWSGIPQRTDTFVGRQQELATLEQLWRSGARLITLTGTGGVGKSRLAAEMLVGCRIPNPVRIDLSEVRSSARFWSLLPKALGVDAPAPSETAAVDYLAEQTAEAPVVVLDDVDHVIEAVRRLVRQSRGRFIVTTRARLALPDESLVEVPPLDAATSVALLQARAGESGASWTDLEALRKLSERLGGTPLALELAAARAGIAQASELLERLDPANLERSFVQTKADAVRATIAWSWSLLPEDTQRVLSEATLFRGGFTLEAAEHVMGTTALSHLEEGVTHSMLVVDHNTRRFQLYPLVRGFAAEQLTDATDACQRFDAWAMWRVETAVAGLDDDDAHRSLPALHADEESLISVLERDHDPAWRTRYLMQLVQLFAHAPAVRQAAESLLATAPETAELWCLVALARRHWGLTTEVLEAAQRALELGIDGIERSYAELMVGRSLALLGDLEGGLELHERAAETARAAGDYHAAARALGGVSSVLRLMGDHERSEAVVVDALSWPDGPDQIALSSTAVGSLLASLAALLVVMGRDDEAVDVSLRYANMCKLSRRFEGQALGHGLAGRALLHMGRGEDAARELRRACELASRTPHTGMLATQRCNLGLALAELGAPDAKDVLKQAIVDARTVERQDHLRWAQVGLGLLHWSEDDLVLARRFLDAAASADTPPGQLARRLKARIDDTDPLPDVQAGTLGDIIGRWADKIAAQSSQGSSAVSKRPKS